MTENGNQYPRDPPPLQQGAQPAFELQTVESVHSCKLPQFWKSSPEAWFLQVEAAFACNQVRNDSTRYNLALAALDSDTVQELLDVIRTLPETGKYDYLKRHILERFADSLDSRLQKLLTAVEADGRKPSQLLRHMRTLAGDQASDELLKVKWLNLLPSTARSILCVLESTSLDKLAEAADRLLETSPTILAAGPPQRAPSLGGDITSSTAVDNSAISALAAEMAALRAGMNQLVSINRIILDKFSSPPTPSAQSSQNRSRSRTPAGQRSSRSSSTDGACFYHRRFGIGARKCEEPCSFSRSLAQGN